MDLQLRDKTALVTGASMGIGRAIARMLAAEGVRVAAVARRMELMAEMADAVEADGHPRPVLIQQDLMAEDAATTLRDAALAQLGHVDILVNNAGGSRVLPIDAPEEKWVEAMTLNFTRQRQLAHALLPQMIERKWGRIINVTGKSEPEHLNAAFAAKAAIHAWAKGLSREVGQHGITVNSIPPGRIMSEQIRRNYPGGLPQGLRREGNPGALLGRTGGSGGDGSMAGLAAGTLCHRRGHPGGWRTAAVPVLSR